MTQRNFFKGLFSRAPVIWNITVLEKNTEKVFSRKFTNTLILSKVFLVKFKAFTEVKFEGVSVHFYKYRFQIPD